MKKLASDEALELLEEAKKLNPGRWIIHSKKVGEAAARIAERLNLDVDKARAMGYIHDIGKNIVKVLLENYSFDVIDLGKDVSPEKIVETACEKQVPLVGLSALMTTTVVSMEETIKMLREKKPDCKVMVGGAVLNQEYADMIGADFYGKDAMQSVHYAEKIFKDALQKSADKKE